MFKYAPRIVFLVALSLFVMIGGLQAQGFSPYFGLGSAIDGSGTTNNSTAMCPSGNLYDDFTGACESGPSMGGVFGVFGADLMLKPHLGINGEYALRFGQASYLPAAGLNMRPAFYDFNAVWQPGPSRHIVPVLEGGLGGSRLELYYSQTTCVTGVCSTYNQATGINANHFQLHGAAGVKIYVKGALFIKPQFDIHWVNNLNQQFGSDWVPQFTVSVGYTLGGS